MRGISPVIATVIILAVTIAIAVAVIGWITGLFGATTGGTEQLQIMPDSRIIVGNNSQTVILHIRNVGSADAVVYKAEVVGLGATENLTLDNTTCNGGCVIHPGQDVTLTFTTSGATAGAQYVVKIYTKNGNVFTATVLAQTS